MAPRNARKTGNLRIFLLQRSVSPVDGISPLTRWLFPHEGSRGLLMDPFNGAADIEAKLLRVLHNYAFLEDPSRLIRATRFAARFHWPMEERTQQRYDTAKENDYIGYLRSSAIGHEIEQLAYEDDPVNILKVYEKEGWLKVLNDHWSSSKADTAGLAALMKTRQQMNELGYTPDVAPAVLYFLTSRLGDKDVADIRKAIPRKDLVAAWKDLEDNAKGLAKRLSGKRRPHHRGRGSCYLPLGLK